MMESKRDRMRKIGLRVVLFLAISILLFYSVSRHWHENIPNRTDEEESSEMGESEEVDNHFVQENTLEDWSENTNVEAKDSPGLERDNDVEDFTQTSSFSDDYAKTTASVLGDSVGIESSQTENDDIYYDENGGEEGDVENYSNDEWNDGDLISWLRGYFDEDNAGTTRRTSTSMENVTVNLAISDNNGTSQGNDYEIQNGLEQVANADVPQRTDETMDESDTFAKTKFAAFSFFAKNKLTTTSDKLDNDKNSENGNTDELQEEVSDENEEYREQNHSDRNQSYHVNAQVTGTSSFNGVVYGMMALKATTQASSSHEYGEGANHPDSGIVENDMDRVNSSSRLALNQKSSSNIFATDEVDHATAAERRNETVKESISKSSTDEYSFLPLLQKLSEVKKEARNNTQMFSFRSVRERMVFLLKSLNLITSTDSFHVNGTPHSDNESDNSVSDWTQAIELNHKLTDKSTTVKYLIGNFQTQNNNTTTITTTTVPADEILSHMIASSTPSSEKPITVTKTFMPNTLVSPPVENESEISQETKTENESGTAVNRQLQDRELQTTAPTTTLHAETLIPDDLHLSIQESLSSTASSAESPVTVTRSSSDVYFNVKEFLGQLDTLLKKQKHEIEEAPIHSHDNINLHKREVREEDAVHHVGFKDGEKENEEVNQKHNVMHSDNGEEKSKYFLSDSQNNEVRTTPSNNGEFQDIDVGVDSNSEGEKHKEKSIVPTKYATGSYVPLTTSNKGFDYNNPRPLSDNDVITLQAPSYSDKSKLITSLVPANVGNAGDSLKTSDYSFGIESNSDVRNINDSGNVKIMSSCFPPTALSKSTHPVTALVSFPGAATDWMRRTLEQLANEPTDSIYRVIARMDEGDITPLLEMNRKVAIATHSNFTQRFNRGILLLKNPLAVEQKHLLFRPYSTEWRSNFLWSQHVVSWLEADIPVMVITYEDMVEDVEGYLLMIADFLNIAPTSQGVACALEEVPPTLIDDVSKISGLYSQDRRLIAKAIDRVIKTAAKTYGHILRRLYMYRSSTGVP